MKNKQADSGLNMHKVCMWLKVTNTLLDTLQQFFVPTIGLYLDDLIQIMTQMIQLLQKD